MKSLILFTLLASFNAHAQSNMGDQTPPPFHGCYKTLEVNHVTITQLPPKPIYPNQEGFFSPEVHNWIMHPETLTMTAIFQFRFFQGYNLKTRGSSSEGGFVIFKSGDENQADFVYDGAAPRILVNYEGSLTVHSILRFRKLPNALVEAYFYRHVDESPISNANDTYLLQPVPCLDRH
jgi:hypothetical protein